MSKTTNKKSAGRPKKPASTKKKIYESPIQVDWQYAYDVIAAKNEAIADLEKRLDLAYREQEEMLKELNKCVNATIKHCDQVQYNTGSIKLHDVEYCADMIKRILNHKFGYKPKIQEL